VLRPTMRTCDACGFENAEEGKTCPLCEASEVTAVRPAADDEETLERPTVSAPIPALPSPIGLVYADRYRVDALLGAGGMGAVYRAHDILDERDVALKVLRPVDDDDQSRGERFKREISVLSKIRHAADPRLGGSRGAAVLRVRARRRARPQARHPAAGVLGPRRRRGPHVGEGFVWQAGRPQSAMGS